MRFEWDLAKDRSNRQKHGVGFDTAERVFADPFAVTVLERMAHEEERWQTIGWVGSGPLLVVVHTYRGAEQSVARIISVRRADRHEQRAYEEAY